MFLVLIQIPVDIQKCTLPFWNRLAQWQNFPFLTEIVSLCLATIAQNIGDMYYALYVVEESESVASLVM